MNRRAFIFLGLHSYFRRLSRVAPRRGVGFSLYALAFVNIPLWSGQSFCITIEGSIL
jgi:hypothetical protein